MLISQSVLDSVEMSSALQHLLVGLCDGPPGVCGSGRP